jgi:zinc protease
VALALALTAAPVYGQRAELEKIIKRRVLANGLEVIVVENHGVPLATVEIDVKNGSFTQTPEYAGLAHMYEHMFFKANERLPEPDQFIDRAAELGAVFNGRTDEERVAYYMTLPADSLAGGLQSIADALRTPLFLKEEIERERQVVIGEYDRNESNPFFKLQAEIGKRLYPGQWSRKNVIGDRDVILTVTPAKMREIQRRYYVPNNSVLIVTGDVNPDSVFALAERPTAIGPVAQTRSRPIPSPKSRAAEKRRSHHRAAGRRRDGAHSVAGPQCPERSQGHILRDVFSDVLNSPTRPSETPGRHGTLAVDRRELLHLDHVGPITISGQTTPGQVEERTRRARAEIQRFTEPGYISKEALEAVKAQRAVSSAFGESGPRASVRRSASGGAWPTSSTTWGMWTTWRSRVWRPPRLRGEVHRRQAAR